MAKSLEEMAAEWIGQFAGLAVIGALKELYEATARQEPPTTWDRDRHTAVPDKAVIEALRLRMRNLDLTLSAYCQALDPPPPAACHCGKATTFESPLTGEPRCADHGGMVVPK